MNSNCNELIRIFIKKKNVDQNVLRCNWSWNFKIVTCFVDRRISNFRNEMKYNPNLKTMKCRYYRFSREPLGKWEIPRWSTFLREWEYLHVSKQIQKRRLDLFAFVPAFETWGINVATSIRTTWKRQNNGGPSMSSIIISTVERILRHQFACILGADILRHCM